MSAQHEPRGPLAGVKVLEFGAIGPVPFCAMLLADMGAEVVYIARPGTPLPAPRSPSIAGIGANWAALGIAGIVNGAISLRQQATGDHPTLSRLAAVPGVLGLVVPAAQTAAGAVVLLGNAAVARLRGR